MNSTEGDSMVMANEMEAKYRNTMISSIAISLICIVVSSLLVCYSLAIMMPEKWLPGCLRWQRKQILHEVQK